MSTTTSQQPFLAREGRMLGCDGARCEQAEALLQPGVLQGRNLVYAAPTGAGKSAVAEILMIRRYTSVNLSSFIRTCRRSGGGTSHDFLPDAFSTVVV